MKIDGKNIILTGAASGIGYEILKILLQYDCRIIAVDLKTKVIKEKSPNLLLFDCDLSKKKNVDKLLLSL